MNTMLTPFLLNEFSCHDKVGEPTLKAANLSQSFSDKVVLDKINLEIKPNKLTALIGCNGTGKTTLLKILAGLNSPTEGYVTFGEKKLSDLSIVERARLIAWVPQYTDVDQRINVWQVLVMGRKPYQGWFEKLNKKDYETINWAIHRLQLQKFIDRPFSTLSGGERQRVIIARAVIQDTPIIFLDEPVSHLDVAHKHHIQDILCNLTDEGKTIVQVLHDLDLAAAYCDEIVLLHKGNILGPGRPAGILTEKNLKQAYDWEINVHFFYGSMFFNATPKSR